MLSTTVAVRRVARRRREVRERNQVPRPSGQPLGSRRQPCDRAEPECRADGRPRDDTTAQGERKCRKRHALSKSTDNVYQVRWDLRQCFATEVLDEAIEYGGCESSYLFVRVVEPESSHNHVKASSFRGVIEVVFDVGLVHYLTDSP